MIHQKKRDNSTELPRLVSLLNDCQVVRMVELLRTFGIFGLYQRGEGDWEVNGVEWLLVKSITGNFSSGFFYLEIFRKSLYIAL